MIDIEKFICSLLADHPEGITVRGDIYRALKEQGLEYKGGKIVPIEDNTELKESEDDKIRKALIDYFDDANKADENPLQSYSIPIDKAIAWLEKQGEQKSTDKIQIGKEYKCITSPRYTMFLTGDIYKAEDRFLCSLMNLCSDCFELVEDSEQNDFTSNIDKVEPKFKDGDWIVYKDDVWKVCNISLQMSYELLKINNEVSTRLIKDVDKEAHLWTITDAKDGDILACGDKVADCPFIFHDLTENSNPRSYCGINTLGQFQVNDENGGFWCHVNDVRPATKEQYDLLFQKMKDDGCKWDSESKELIKIEQV